MEPQDLFAVGRKKKRAPRPKSPHAKRIQEIMLRVYFPLYCRRSNNEKPLIQGKHWAMLRNIVDQYGPDLVEARLRAFFASSDRWIRESSGYTLGAFISQWQKLAAEANQNTTTLTTGGQPQSPCLHLPKCPSPVDHGRRVIEDMKGSRPHTPQTPREFSRTTSMPSDPF